MSQAQQELNIFSIEELKYAVRNAPPKDKENGRLKIEKGVLIFDFQALYAADVYGNWYLIGGDTTRKIIQYLNQNSVQLCLIYYGDIDGANAALNLLKRDKISNKFKFLVHSYKYDNKKVLLDTCHKAFVPWQRKDEYIGRLVFLGCQAKDMKANVKLGITGILLNCSSLNGNIKNETELFFGLGVAQQQFALRKIKITQSRNRPDADYTVEENNEDKYSSWLSSAWKRFLDKLGSYTVNPKCSVFEEAKHVPATLPQWLLRNFFFPAWWKKWNWDGFKSALLTAFLVTYEFDGYDSTTGKIVYADDLRNNKDDKRYAGQYVSKSLLKATFFALPSRPTAFPANPSEDGAVIPELTRLQVISNLFGGIDWNENTPIAKMYLQIFGSPIKFPLIFLIKVVAWPFKFTINVLKLFTEMLPWFLSIVMFSTLLRTLFVAHESFQLMKQLYNVPEPRKEIVEDLLGWPKYVASKIGVIVMSIPMVVAGAVSLAVYTLYTACNLALIIGRAGTSPEKSMRMALANGISLDIGGTRYAFGGLLAKLSISLSTCIWALVFPLLFTGLVSIAPLIVIQKVNWVLQFPVVNASFIWVQGIFFTIKPYFVMVFGSTLATVSTFIGTDLATLGIIGIMSLLVALPMTIITDNLSNWWADWHVKKNVTIENNIPEKPLVLTESDFEESELGYDYFDAKHDKKAAQGFYQRFIKSGLDSVVRFFYGNSDTVDNDSRALVHRSKQGFQAAYSAAKGADDAYSRTTNGAKKTKRHAPIIIALGSEINDSTEQTAHNFY